MNRDNEKQSEIILALLGIVPIVWISLLIAPFIKEGLPSLFSKLGEIFNNPFHIVLCKDSLKTVLIFLLIYGMAIGIYFSSKDTLNKLGYKAKINTHTTSYIN